MNRLVLLFVLAACAGAPVAPRAPSAAHVECPDPIALPFARDFNLVWLEVSVAGSRPLAFLLDSGFDGSAIDAATAAALGLAITDPETVPQPGGAVTTGSIAPTAIAAGGRALWELPLTAVPLASLAPFVGRRLDGVLGHDALAPYVVDLDYAEGVVTLCAPDGARYRGPATAIPLAIEATSVDRVAAFVQGTIVAGDGRAVGGRFKLDTGGMGTLGLFANFARDAGLPAAGQAVLREPGLALGGATEGQVFRVAAVQLGDQRLRDVPIGLTTSAGGFEERPYAGTLAGEILGRFHVVLDYPHRAMYLAPRGDAGARFAYDASGLRLVAPPGALELEVLAVLDASPAAADLRAGDRVVGVDGRPAADVGLAGMWDRLRVAGPLRLTVLRDGARREVELTLRERI